MALVALGCGEFAHPGTRQNLDDAPDQIVGVGFFDLDAGCVAELGVTPAFIDYNGAAP